jgi:dipeptidyl aminopeptidase/acylaminoacyl peptidase
MARHLLPVLLVWARLLCGAEPTLPVPSNLTAEGIPGIPASLLEELAPYTEFRTATLADWNPMSREMLIITRFGQAPQVHRVTQPGGARTQLTFYPDRVAGGRYCPDGNSFLFTKDVGGGEWYQIYSYDTRTGRTTLMTDGNSRNTDPVCSWAGQNFAYASTRRNGRNSDIYVADPDKPTEAKRVVEADSGGWAPDDFTGDGWLAVTRSISAYESALFLVNTVTGERKPLSPQKLGVSYRHARFDQGGEDVYLITNQDSDFEQLAKMDIATQKITILTPGLHWDVTSFDLQRDGRYIVYIANENGADKLHLIDTVTREERPLAKLPDGSISDVRWHPGGTVNEIAFTIASARTPSDVYSMSTRTFTVGNLTRWTYSETGGLDASQFAEPELIHWKSFDGLTISGYLYMPPKRFTGPRPVIVNIVAAVHRWGSGGAPEETNKLPSRQLHGDAHRR